MWGILGVVVGAGSRCGSAVRGYGPDRFRLCAMRGIEDPQGIELARSSSFLIYSTPTPANSLLRYARKAHAGLDSGLSMRGRGLVILVDSHRVISCAEGSHRALIIRLNTDPHQHPTIPALHSTSSCGLPLPSPPTPWQRSGYQYQLGGDPTWARRAWTHPC